MLFKIAKSLCLAVAIFYDDFESCIVVDDQFLFGSLGCREVNEGERKNEEIYLLLLTVEANADPVLPKSQSIPELKILSSISLSLIIFNLLESTKSY